MTPGSMFRASQCLFCMTPEDRLPRGRVLVAGAASAICEDCILLCADIVEAGRTRPRREVAT